MAVSKPINTQKNATDALQTLINGNKNFMSMSLKSIPTKERFAQLRDGQNPHTAILSCSDSRVSIEFVFDAGLGDIFVVRNAGNLLDDHGVWSFEYAAAYLGVRLIVIMGHQECAAVMAVIDNSCIRGYTKAFAESFAKDIQPSVELAREQEGDLTTNAIKNNAILYAKKLVEKSKPIENLLKDGLVIMPAYYSIATGEVEFLKEHQISHNNI